MMNKIEEIKGKAVAVVGNDIDTDRIIPARFLKEITFEKMGHYVFYDARFNADESPKEHPFNAPEHRDANILIVNRNFGCGSSREHAPQSIKRYGIKAIIGESFAEIFAGNCKAIGVPVITASAETIKDLQALTKKHPETQFQIDIKSQTIQFNDQQIEIKLPAGHQSAFLSGDWDIISVLEENKEEIQATDQRLPY